MTISSSTRTAGPFPGAGVVATMPFGFKVFQASDLLVVATDSDLVQTTMVLSSDYTVALNSDQHTAPGGAVMTLAVVPTGTTIYVTSNIAMTQPMRLTNAGGFFPSNIEDAFDRLTIIQQQNSGGQLLRVPIGEQLSALPSAQYRKGKLLGFDDSTGQPVALVAPDASGATSLDLSLRSSTSSITGAGQLGYGAGIAYEAGTIGARVLQRKNFRDIGMVADGNYATGAGTDNTAALQAGINALSVSGGGVLVDDGGIYKLGSQVTVPSGVSIIGTGKWTSILFCPSTFGNTGGLIRINGTGGYPTVFRGFAVLAQTGGAGGSGIVSVKNGLFISDVWVNGFLTGSGIQISSTDNFLSDFYIEICLTGLYISQCAVNVSHGAVYDCANGVTIANVASVELARTQVTGVRAIHCALSGFAISAAKQVSISGCAASHDNAGFLTVAGMLVDASSDVVVSGFNAKLGSVSATAYGVKITSSSGVVVSGSRVSGWLDGIGVFGSSEVTISGNSANSNRRVGISVDGGDGVIISGNNASANGTGSSGDAGIKSANTAAFSNHSITGNICLEAGGGPQEYGIFASVTNNGANSGVTLLANNICRYNNTSEIEVSGLVANIFQSGNFPGIAVGTMPSAVASAPTITLPLTASRVITVTIVGTTSITSVAPVAGLTAHLIFQGILTFTDGSNLKLSGDFITTVDDTITITCDGTNWYECCRSAN